MNRERQAPNGGETPDGGEVQEEEEENVV